MKTIRYFKLVRDKIPEIIEKDPNKHAHYRPINNNGEFLGALESKLVEEIRELLEVAEKNDELMKPKIHDEIIDEMADIIEVLGYMYGRNDIFSKLERRAAAKYHEKGGFDKRYFLKYVTEEEDDG